MSDVDSATLASATVQITGNYQTGQDVLACGSCGGISASFTAATGLLTLTGTETLANYQAALRSVTYQNTSDAPTTTTRTVTWIGNDGAVSSTPVTSTITVTATNDAPVLTAGATLNYTEGQAATVIDATVTATDADTATLAGATVQIAANYQNGQDVLAFTNTPNITGAFTAATRHPDLDWRGHAGQLSGGAAQSVTYQNTSAAPATAPRTVTWIGTDGTSNSTPVTSTITVTAVNSAPVLTAGGTLNYTENQPPQAIDATLHGR